MKKYQKIFTSFLAATLLLLANGIAVAKPPHLTPPRLTPFVTWHTEVSTLKASVRFYNFTNYAGQKLNSLRGAIERHSDVVFVSVATVAVVGICYLVGSITSPMIGIGILAFLMSLGQPAITHSLGVTSGAVVVTQTGSDNKVSSIQRTGINAASAVPATQQRQAKISEYVAKLPKGIMFSVFVKNNHDTDDEDFLMFDVCGIAAARGASPNGADITYRTTFAGTNSAAGYTALKEHVKGTHYGVLGTSFNFSDESIIDTCGFNVWMGNAQNFNSMNLSDYFNLANDNYSNDQKRLNMQSEVLINTFLAFSGTLPAGGSINILFSVAAVSNY